MIIGLSAALGAALCYGCGTLFQAAAARRVHGLAAAVSPLAIVGWILDAAAWLLTLVAFQSLPLFVVQAIMTGQLVVVVLGDWLLTRRRPRSLTLAMAGTVMAGLAVLAFGSGEQPAKVPATPVVIGLMVAAGLVALGVVAAYRRGSGWLLSALAGLGYSLAAISARGLHFDLDKGLKALIAQPLLISLVIGGVAGALAYVRSLERAGAPTVAAVSGVIEVVLPGIAGLAFLGDLVRPGWQVPDLLAVLVCLAGCVVLTRDPAVAQSEGTPSGTAAEAAAAPTVTEPAGKV
ncbi:MAG: hypothetical protein LBR27_04745 [Bifidobacteriaceae bacterium]|jgi:drug/metabolite transporter (DMT)-like permease|nr:hypothetical protein [Bifidobacteriaceae bacterium]